MGRKTRPQQGGKMWDFLEDGYDNSNLELAVAEEVIWAHPYLLSTQKPGNDPTGSASKIDNSKILSLLACITHRQLIHWGLGLRRIHKRMRCLWRKSNIHKRYGRGQQPTSQRATGLLLCFGGSSTVRVLGGVTQVSNEAARAWARLQVPQVTKCCKILSTLY